MSDKKPPTLIEYKTWLANEHMCEVERTRPYYESVTSKVQRDLENSELWQRLTTFRCKKGLCRIRHP